MRKDALVNIWNLDTILAVDPGSREMGVAMVRPAGGQTMPFLVGTWRLHTSAKTFDARFRAMNTQAAQCVGYAITHNAQRLVIEKPPRMWAGKEGGRQLVQDHLFVLGLFASITAMHWSARGGGPMHLVEVGQWRKALKGIHAKANQADDWKDAAIRTVSRLYQKVLPADVAEAVLLGVACALDKGLTAE
jgi:hypothetical protein